MLDPDRAPGTWVRGHGGDGPGGQGFPGGRAAYEQDARAVRRPDRVEVLPLPVLAGAVLPGQTRQPARAAAGHGDGPDPVRAPGHRITTALGTEGEGAAVGRPGGRAVVERAVGERAQAGAVRVHHPEVEGTAAVGAHRHLAAVGGEHRAAGFEVGRGQRRRGRTVRRQ